MKSAIGPEDIVDRANDDIIGLKALFFVFPNLGPLAARSSKYEPGCPQAPLPLRPCLDRPPERRADAMPPHDPTACERRGRMKCRVRFLPLEPSALEVRGMAPGATVVVAPTFGAPEHNCSPRTHLRLRFDHLLRL